MIKRFYVRTSSLREGMKIDQSIKDRMDRTLIARGTYLDSFTIEGLKKRGVTGVYIQEGEEDPEPEKLESLPPVAAKNIEKLRTQDPAKVRLSESVKKGYPRESSISTTIPIPTNLSILQIRLQTIL